MFAILKYIAIYITIDLIASLIHVGNKGRYINNKFIE